jgi:hypothetical protein
VRNHQETSVGVVNGARNVTKCSKNRRGTADRLLTACRLPVVVNPVIAETAMFERPVLSSILDRLRADLASSSDAEALLREHRQYLCAQADAADAEWLFDRFADLGRDAGVNPDGARHTRRLAARKGNAAALSYYAELLVGRSSGFVHPLPIELALDRLAAGGGYMTWTWGYDPTDRVAWLSDAQAGCSDADIECAHEVFRHALTTLGLELRFGA